MNTEHTMFRALSRAALNERVRMARRMKLVPPAKSVSLSNLNVNAITKKKSWYPTVMRNYV
jgi:hypothetical protein